MDLCRKELFLFLLFCLLTTAVLFFACDSGRSISQPPVIVPANIVMRINNGSDATNDTCLNVNIQADNSDRMLIGLDSLLRDADWEDFDTLKILHVPRREGQVSAYGRFATSGSGTTGIFQDYINLDFTAYINSIQAYSELDTLQAGSVVEFTMETGEDGQARVSFSSIRINYSLERIVEGLFRRTLIIPSGINEDDVETVGYFTDAVGNEAEPVTAQRKFSVRGPGFDPQVITRYPLDNVLGSDIWIHGRACFVCDTHSVHILDISDPLLPSRVGVVHSGLWSKGFAGDDLRLFIPYRYGLAVMYIQPPDQSYIISRELLNEIATDVVLGDLYAYVSCKSCGMVILDILDRNEPLFLSRLTLNPGGEHICLEGEVVYLVSGTFGFVIDVSVPENPSSIGTFEVSGESQDMVVFEDYLFVATMHQGVYAFDVSIPENPVLIARRTDLTPVYSFELSPPFLYIGGDNDILIVNVTQPQELNEVAHIEDVGIVNGIFVKEDYLYACGPSMMIIAKLFSADSD